MLKHRAISQNQVKDALSWRSNMLITLQTQMTHLEFIKEFYDQDKDFAHIWQQCKLHPIEEFYIHKGYFFKN